MVYEVAIMGCDTDVDICGDPRCKMTSTPILFS